MRRRSRRRGGGEKDGGGRKMKDDGVCLAEVAAWREMIRRRKMKRRDGIEDRPL